MTQNKPKFEFIYISHEVSGKTYYLKVQDQESGEFVFKEVPIGQHITSKDRKELEIELLKKLGIPKYLIQIFYGEDFHFSEEIYSIEPEIEISKLKPGYKIQCFEIVYQEDGKILDFVPYTKRIGFK